MTNAAIHILYAFSRLQLQTSFSSSGRPTTLEPFHEPGEPLTTSICLSLSGPCFWVRGRLFPWLFIWYHPMPLGGKPDKRGDKRAKVEERRIFRGKNKPAGVYNWQRCCVKSNLSVSTLGCIDFEIFRF